VATITLSCKSFSPFTLFTSKIKLQFISEKIKLFACKILETISPKSKFIFFLSKISIHSNKTMAGIIIVALPRSQESKTALALLESFGLLVKY
jgi:hypothetical protein